MRLYRITTIFFLSLVNCVCATTFAHAAESFIQQEKKTEILKLLAFTDNENEIGKKWEIFLKERAPRFNNKDYQAAIAKLKDDYDRSEAILNSCIKNSSKESKKYSSSWINDFKQRFDKKFVLKNFDSIRFVVSALWITNNASSCEEEVKEAIYREYRQLDAAKYYVKEYLEFCNTLNVDEKKKYSVSISAAESYLNNFEYPLQSILSDDGLKGTLFSVAMIKHKDLDPRLIDFFSTHPFFQKPFDPIKAVKELEALAPPQAAD